MIGTCGLFTVRDFHTSNRSEKQARYVDVRHRERSNVKVHARKMKRSVVTYICFECCEMSRGCCSSRSASLLGSVCLRGGDSAVLEYAKKILLFLTQVRLSIEREIAFYINLGMTSTTLALEAEPVMFAKKPRYLASSPNVIFGK